MNYLSVQQMREADRRAIEDIGIPSVVLMENAGRSVFDQIQADRISVICGKGNNGGDGFVVARHALLHGRLSGVYTTHSPDEFTHDSGTFLRAFQNLGGRIEVLSEENCSKNLSRILNDSEVVVDAVLGTGCSGEVRGIARRIIDGWPEVETISVDIPSGLNADTGEPCGNAVRASQTVTFQFSKKGFLNPVSKAYTGTVLVADIGIPSACGIFESDGSD